ncbi:transcriptional-regulating factor 1-like isoform X3 [Haliotis rufescens]|uniref:transcriptional-regulating factor 1-like isoform X3 n=1 Tax=Haliotis rufescens TaxID=6454 RepID=UPI00201EA324|nr:transcriptional-regulating factor 1-like isoform X3 [Haliotis rufescens]
MEAGQKGADNSELVLSGIPKMDTSGLPLPIIQAADLQNCQAFPDQGTSLSYVFPTIPLSINASIPLLTEGLKTLPVVKEEKGLRQTFDPVTTQALQDIVNSGLYVPFSKMSDSNFTQNSDNGKDVKSGFERQDMQTVGGNLAEDKGMSPLNILVVSYPDTGQQSPSVTQAGAQGLRFQSAGGAGDAMLSAINYNDSDMLPDSAFDMNAANSAPNLPHLDDGILGSMGNPAQNIRLTEGHPTHSFDLFDSNVHDTLSLSPQPFSDPSFSVTDTSNLSATTGDSEGSGERRQSVESPTDGASKAKGKNRQPKAQVSPSKTMIQCPTCNKAFNNSSALAKHRLTHSDERKYVCSVCQKGFKRQDHLNGHMMTHREKKPYQCQMEGCEKSYCDARSLRRHLEANHHQSPEAIANSVQASMAAAGIPTTTPGKPRPAEKLAVQEAVSRMQMGGSPSYSANTTPSPSPSYTSPNPQGQIFQFETQSGLPTTVVSTQQATPPQDQSWQERARVYDFVVEGTSGSSQPSPHSGDQSPGYAAQVSPVTPVSPIPHNQPTSPLTGQQRPAWFTTTPTPQTENKNTSEETKPPVQCSICQRRFKNIPALNGHMRLHGGYLKKSKEEKKAAKKTEMGPPPPPSPRQTVATANPTQLQVQMSPVLPNISQAFQTLSTTPEVSTSQSTLQACGLTTVTVHQGQISHDSQLLRQQQPQQVIHQQLQLHPNPQILEEQSTNSIEEQIKNLQAQAFQQQQQQDQLAAAQDQLPSSHAQQAAQQIQQLVQSVQADQLPQLTVQQLEQLQQHPPQQIQVQQPLGQIHQLPQLSPQQIEQLQQQHLQLGLPAQLQATQLHQLVQEHHLHQLQQQQVSQAEVITTHSQPISSSQQFIQLTPQQQQQLQQLAEITHIPVQEMLDDSKDSAAEKQQQIQQIQQHLAAVDQQTAQSSGQQNPFPQNVEFTSAGEVQIAQHQSQDLPQQINLDIAARDLPPNLELQLPQQLLPLQSPPITLNSVAIQSSLQNALSLVPHLEQRQVLSGSGQTQFVSAPHLTTGPISLSPVTDNQEVTVAQLLNSMANFQEGLLLQPTSQTQTGIPSDISVMQSQPSVTLNQDNLSNIQSTFNPLHMPQSVSIQSLPTPQQMLDSITSMPHLYTIKSEHLPMDIQSSVLGEGSMAPKHKSDFKPIVEQNSELKRRLSADLDRSCSPKKLLTSQNSLAMLLTRPGGDSFAKPSLTKDLDAVSRVRMRSKSGDDHKLKRSKSVDHTFMRPRSRTESESIYRPKSRVDDTIIGRAKSHPDDMLSRSDGAGVFRNPMSASPMKVKRKHRPAPLFIPLHLNSFQSRLRSPRLWDGGDGRLRGSTPPPYTPPPMLSPIRSGSGLFWTLPGIKPITPRSAPITPKLSLANRRASHGHKPEAIPEVVEEEQEEAPPETDIQPHVNVGTQYQAELPAYNSDRSRAAKCVFGEDLVWEPRGMGSNSDEDVQYYQDFACSAAVKGNGSNVEYALHLLYLCEGNVQNAMLMLMDDPPKLPRNHGISAFKYQESDPWTSQEIEAFHQALLRFSKDFFAVSNEVKTKNTKQCIQFYYLWKKVCPEDYKKLRALRRKREQEALYNLRSRPQGEEQQQQQPQQQQQQQQQQQPQLQPHPQQQQQEESDSEDSISAHSGEPNEIKSDLESSSMSSSPAPTYTCDYPECNAIFTSKQALNGHSRMHGGGPVRPPPPFHDTMPERPQPPPPPPPPPHPHPHPHPHPPVQRKPRPATPSKPPATDGTGDIFPCKLCNRVFYKVKSRSAHMKSHKVQDNEKNKARELELAKLKAAAEVL